MNLDDADRSVHVNGDPVSAISSPCTEGGSGFITSNMNTGEIKNKQNWTGADQLCSIGTRLSVTITKSY
jgi:hypothetical protein